MKKISLPLLLLILAGQALLSSCHTMHGAGQDIERAGEKIQENADNH